MGYRQECAAISRELCTTKRGRAMVKGASIMLKIQIVRPIAEQLVRYFSNHPIERGCLIGSSRYLNRIDHFVPVPGTADMNQFTPDMDAVNRQIATWKEQGICFCGFFHSHPNGPAFLSRADRSAIESWVYAADLPFLCFGLADGNGTLILHLAEKNNIGQVIIRPMQQCAVPGFFRYFVWRVEDE